MSGEQDCDDPLNRNNVKIRYEGFQQLATARSLSNNYIVLLARRSSGN